MPRRSLTVSINTEVYKWLKRSSGWSNEKLARRLSTSVQVINKIELGKKDPTLRQLRILSTAFRRPIAAFFLAEPKKEKPKPKDYRMIPGKEGKFGRKTLLVLRKARELQSAAKELAYNINYTIKSKKPKSLGLSNDPSKSGNKYRKLFDITLEKQKKFKSPYKFFYYLRDVMEEMNIFVFQFSMPAEDARGFVFVDERPFVIVVNTKDNIKARLFSLMHEFGHILLRKTAIDLPSPTTPTKNKVERWCNKFAASFLFPHDLAASVFRGNKQKLTTKKTLKYLSNKYKVSKAMLLVSMRKTNHISQKKLEEVLNRYRSVKKKKSKSSGGIPYDKKRFSEMGDRFISLVADNFDKEKITYSDALNYLSIKSKKFDKLLLRAKK